MYGQAARIAAATATASMDLSAARAIKRKEMHPSRPSPLSMEDKSNLSHQARHRLGASSARDQVPRSSWPSIPVSCKAQT